MAPIPPTEDYYWVLEIDQAADSAIIRSSYKRLAKLRHPDKAGNDARATADFQLLAEAYSTLSDPKKRSAYDKVYESIKRTRQTRHSQPNSASNTTFTAHGDSRNTLISAELQQTLSRLINEQAKLGLRIMHAEANPEEIQSDLDRIQRELDELEQRIRMEGEKRAAEAEEYRRRQRSARRRVLQVDSEVPRTRQQDDFSSDHSQTRPKAAHPRPCRHQSWWDKIGGQHECWRCKQRMRKFAFQCPQCQIVACETCRHVLKGGDLAL